MSADPSNPVDIAEVSKSHAIHDEVKHDEKELATEKSLGAEHAIEEVPQYNADDAALTKTEPTEEDMNSLRRVPGDLNWPAYTVAFVELCERFSYYGTTIVCMYQHSLVDHC